MADLVLESLTVKSPIRTVLRDVGLHLRAGELVALVGASGSGKTLVARALLNALPAGLNRVGGRLWAAVEGHRYAPWDQPVAGGPIHQVVGWVPQDAKPALCPGWTVLQAVRQSGASNKENALSALQRAGFDEPASIAHLYPHQLSGGMATRVVLAQALARPRTFLVADEPTTGLDLHIQRHVAQTLAALSRSGLGVLFVTHDLDLVRTHADHVLIVDAGRIVERLRPSELWEGRASSAAGRALVAGAKALSLGEAR